MVEDREPLPSRIQGLPELPAEAAVALDSGLAILELGALPTADRTALLDHLRLLAAWNRAINLTSIREPLDAVRLHLLDSLTAVPVLRSRAADSVLDIGSGGGFPGLTLAIALPLRRTVLAESVGKKARFLETAVSALGVGDRVEAFAGRVETLARDGRHRGRWPAVTARAVGDLAELAEIGLPLLRPGGVLVAWKRGDVEAEIEASRAAIGRLGGGRPVVVPVDERLGLRGHRLVVVEKTGPTPAEYPRDPAARRRRPL